MSSVFRQGESPAYVGHADRLGRLSQLRRTYFMRGVNCQRLDYKNLILMFSGLQALIRGLTLILRVVLNNSAYLEPCFALSSSLIARGGARHAKRGVSMDCESECVINLSCSIDFAK